LHLSAAEWKNLLQTREDLYYLFSKPLKQGALEALNAGLAEVLPYRQLLTKHRLVRWAWRTPPGDSVQLLGPILFDAAELLTSGSFQKIRECRGGACGWLFLDRSQAGKRRWCSMGDCGNRDKVRHYYRRKQLVEAAKR
jgi:predicted RNA-binding Zn ribbon-like protein